MILGQSISLVHQTMSNESGFTTYTVVQHEVKKCFYKLLMSYNLVKILHALVFLSMGFLIDNLLLQLFYI